MIETQVSIRINQKADLELVKQVVIGRNIDAPVYILEFESHYEVNFTSDYEHWELNGALLSLFPEYMFTNEPPLGGETVRLLLSREQSPYAIGDWGRPIENPLHETKFMVKQKERKPMRYSPKVDVLFGDTERPFYIHVTSGVNQETSEKGFLLVNEFRDPEPASDADVLTDRLYPTVRDAFYSGYTRIQDMVQQDFEVYAEERKKATQAQQRIPRKMVREFIKACNLSDRSAILKHLDDRVVFEKRNRQWKMEVMTEGIESFRNYLDSPEQDLFARDMKIRSSWSIDLPKVKIGVKFSPVPDPEGKFLPRYTQYRQITFLFDGDKIIQVLEEEE